MKDNQKLTEEIVQKALVPFLDKMKKKRKARGLSYKKLAEIICEYGHQISESTVRRAELGEYELKALDMIFISYALEIDMMSTYIEILESYENKSNRYFPNLYIRNKDFDLYFKTRGITTDEALQIIDHYIESKETLKDILLRDIKHDVRKEVLREIKLEEQERLERERRREQRRKSHEEQ
ncbi:hypothetical protein [Bacillus sp. AK128]